MARRPRWLKADAAYCEVQRTVDRQFFFKPDEIIRNIIGSAAGRALKRFPIVLYWLDFNINHKHNGRAALSDSPAHLMNLVRFDQLFNSLVARGLNAHFGREGSLYATRNRSTEAIDDLSLEQQLYYSVTNPVKDGLVDRVAHWKGFSSYKQLSTGEVDRYWYIDWTAWHRAGGKRSGKAPALFVEWVEVPLSPIPSWAGMPEHKRQALFRRGVREVEQACRQSREQEGRKVMGQRKLARLDPRDRPGSPPESRGPQPRCHSSTLEGALAYKERLGEFLNQYYYASGLWQSGVRDVIFPRGSIKPPLIQLAA